MEQCFYGKESRPHPMQKTGMRFFPLLLLLPFSSCGQSAATVSTESTVAGITLAPRAATGTWKHFLQNLPRSKGTVRDYRGRAVADQSKAWAVLSYDVGNRDLQQCADALMRLRAEYLYAQGRGAEIEFRFTSGEWFRYKDYLNGLRPKISGGTIYAGQVDKMPDSYQALRNYLDILYAFASTQSLARDLPVATGFETGTVVITPGSPGHCFIIIDEGRDAKGVPVYMLAESYMPAQTIYILQNPDTGGPWHYLQRGTIETATYSFTQYKLCRFE
jgi:hypothetical protein